MSNVSRSMQLMEIRDTSRRVLFAAVVLALTKYIFFRLTNSIAVLADALSTVVTMVSTLVMIYSSWATHRPSDRDEAAQPRGEFLAIGLEGWIILSIGLFIGYLSLWRLFGFEDPPPQLDKLGTGIWGLVVVAIAMVAGAGWLWIKSRSLESLLLWAQSKHLLTDAASSLGVILGLVIIRATDLQWLDPIVALVVAALVLWVSWKMLWKSISGLTDEQQRDIDPPLRSLLDKAVESERIIAYDQVRYRLSGSKQFVELRLLVDPKMSIRAGRELGAAIESELREALGGAAVVARVEPHEDGPSHKSSHGDEGATPQPKPVKPDAADGDDEQDATEKDSKK
ncbi:MAG: cation diffusion facilitator family transporter [Phycisphaeraceae bacterium]